MTKKDFNTVELLSRLRKLGVELRVENDKLRIDAPKGVVSSSLREELSQRKAEILQFLAGSAPLQSYHPMPLQRVQRKGGLPLSFSQERLWFLSQLEPDNIAYNISGCARLEGQLRVDILERTLSEITRRHEILRTTFSEIDRKPVQVIAPPSPFNLQKVDLRGFPDKDRRERAKQVIIEEVQRPFDLSKGPLFRAVLMQMGPEEHFLIIVMHHIITDGWSSGVLMRELETLYGAYLSSLASPLPDLPIQYADFAHWQRAWLQGEVLATQLSYWKQKLSGNLPVLQLPTDRPRPAVQRDRGSHKSFVFANHLKEELYRLSQAQGVTPFMTLLAGFKTLLHRYTGQTDFAVGSPIANRNRSEIEGLMGFFVNTLVLRTDLSGDPRFLDLLTKVRETTVDAYSHQDLPFEKLVEELRPARDLSYSPLFQVMFAFQNFPLSSIRLPGLLLTPVSFDAGTSMYDLTLFMREDEWKGLSGRIEYNTDLFNAATMDRMCKHFEELLKSAVTNPERRLSELSFLTESERHQILIEWNDTSVPYPEDNGFIGLFEDQVSRAPDAIAVVYAGRELTYGELNRRANQLAEYLRALGAGPDDRIGIYIHRSIDMVVGLLGILKAGCAYTPLDPSFPEDRVEFMLKDSKSRILVSQSGLTGNIKEFSGEIICIDSDWDRISKEDNTNPKVLSGPDNLAYVIYTSGSTGKPKGVQIPHRALTNFLCSMQKKPGFTHQDTILSVTTMSFDIFGLEVFLPLIAGGKVVIACREDTLDGSRLSDLLKSHRVSVMQATPSTWRLLIESGWDGDRSLKAICGGEAMPADLAGPLLDRCGILWNLYGPTETTIWSTAYRVESKDGPILIGSPIANTETYILDNSLHPVPIGVVGELHIGGDGLSLGYLNRPELTFEKFIPHPFKEASEARIYKTGDLARYRADGNIECLGRMDGQVKLRGFRIELGEIEVRMKDMEAIHRSVVMVREDRPGDQRLVGYYVAKEGSTVSVSDLRRHLHSKLPDYMVPQQFVQVTTIPLTPNGKVDRKALPKPDSQGIGEKNYVAPRTEFELAITAIWQQVLQLEKVGVQDNFFELGGHSLLIVHVLSKIREFSGRDIPMIVLFQYPTISSLCRYLDGAQVEQPRFQKVYDRVQRQEESMMKQSQVRKARRDARD